MSLASPVSSPSSPQEQRADMEAEAPTFQDLEDFGAELIDSGHRDSPEIDKKLQAVRQERDDLEKAWEQRKKMLNQCLEYQVQLIYNHGAYWPLSVPSMQFHMVKYACSFHWSYHAESTGVSLGYLTLYPPLCRLITVVFVALIPVKRVKQNGGHFSA